MKKQFYLFGLLIVPFFVDAQNVGIGTTTPSARLQINHRSFTTVGLQLLDSSASSAGSIRFSTINNPVGMTISSFYESSFNKGHYLDINSDTAFVATFRGNGNVGLGVESPLYRLDINGDINTNGLLRINGNAGTTGQVLTSNGSTADPTWVTPGLSHYVGELFGGGVIVALWKIAGAEHGLIVSLTNLNLGMTWSNIVSPAGATSSMDGQGNTAVIVAQPGHLYSAAQLCLDYSFLGFTDWYLPSAWELRQCFNSAFVVNTIAALDNSLKLDLVYWSSTENIPPFSFSIFVQSFINTDVLVSKTSIRAVRAVRKF